MTKYSGMTPKVEDIAHVIKDVVSTPPRQGKSVGPGVEAIKDVYFPIGHFPRGVKCSHLPCVSSTL